MITQEQYERLCRTQTQPYPKIQNEDVADLLEAFEELYTELDKTCMERGTRHKAFELLYDGDGNERVKLKKPQSWRDKYTKTALRNMHPAQVVVLDAIEKEEIGL